MRLRRILAVRAHLVASTGSVDEKTASQGSQNLVSAWRAYALIRVADSIEPRLHGARFRAVPLEAGGVLIVARLPRSSSGIHRQRRDGHFVVRESRSNREPDVPGIVSRISDLLGREDRVRDFFARRYADILTAQYPESRQSANPLFEAWL